MKWIDKLIALYLYICEVYDNKLCLHCQRMSNNYSPEFTDQELLTVYLFGIIHRRFRIKDIHSYCQDHFLDCFPDLPSYQAFNYRLNRMGEVFPTLLEEILLNGQQQGIDWSQWIVQTMHFSAFLSVASGSSNFVLWQISARSIVTEATPYRV